MKTAHLILAHNAPEQLGRLVKRLQHPDTSFFIHIDQKADITPFRPLTEMNNVHLIEDRVNVKWGAYSIVQATINGFKTILSSGQSFSHINLLSGSDYPLKNTSSIHGFFEANPDTTFMHFLSVEEEWQEAIPRLTEYHLTNFNFPGKYKVQRLLKTILPPRKMPHKLVPVGRSQWFSITVEATAYIIDYLAKHPDVVRFFKLTWAPDEIIFQTILYNSPLRNKMVNDSLRYVDWSAGKPNPKTLIMEDAGKLFSSGKLFARKFDIKTSPEILDYIDKTLDA